MRKPFLLAGAILALAPAAAQAAPARSITLAAGETKTYSGATATGLNANYFDITDGNGGMYAAPGTCSTDTQSYCDTTLLSFSNPVPEDDADGKLTKKVTVTLGEYGPVPDPASDFDLLAFKSDATGARGAELGRDGDTTDTAAETVSFTLTTTRAEPTAHVLLDVVYFAVVNGSFKATIKG